VGRDQVQHIEMARDFGQRFNHLYGEPAGKQFFTLPEAAIEEHVATLPGLDGRKMSKSYDNTIALFAPRDQLKKLIFAIKTDSRAPGEPKPTQDSALFQLYQAFATPAEVDAMRKAFADGIAWGDAKQQLFERIDLEVAPLREKYDALMGDPAKIEALLRDGAQRLRTTYATPLLKSLRASVGLRDLSSQAAGDTAARAEKRATPVFKQYREADGRFYFKLVDGDRVLLQSEGFESARDAGQLVARARQDAGRSVTLDAATGTVRFGDGVVGRVPPEGSFDELRAALAQFAEQSP
jgi:tryptophanyl-tRNA synthetase